MTKSRRNIAYLGICLALAAPVGYLIGRLLG